MYLLKLSYNNDLLEFVGEVLVCQIIELFIKFSLTTRSMPSSRQLYRCRGCLNAFNRYLSVGIIFHEYYNN